MAVKEKTAGFFGEFKAFIARGNVLDMAVGVIIGAAFGAISTSLVNDMIMPIISLLTGGINFDDWKLVLKAAEYDGAELVSEAVTLNFGNFLSTVLNFFIVAFAVFLLIKAVNTAANKAAEIARLKKEAEEKKEEEKPTKDQVLLTEIRDLLKAQNPGAEPVRAQGGQSKKKGKR